MFEDRALLTPHIFTNRLPPEERESAQHAGFLLGQLAQHLKGFRASVRLFQHCGNERQAAKNSGRWIYDPDRDHGTWMFIAARAGAMEVFHYWTILQALKGTIGRCDSLRHLIDHTAIKQALRLLEAWFDPIELRRHAISHASEMVESPENFRFNFPSDTGDWFMTALDEHGTFKLKHEGNKLTMAIDDTSLAKLERVTRSVFAAVKPAADWTFQAR